MVPCTRWLYCHGCLCLQILSDKGDSKDLRSGDNTAYSNMVPAPIKRNIFIRDDDVISVQFKPSKGCQMLFMICVLPFTFTGSDLGFTAVTVMVTGFWDILECSPVDAYR
jgi:hypothetical protein